MASHEDVVIAFTEKRKLKGNSMYSEGNSIYSWGYHFCIATHLKDGSILFNTDHYSCSTSQHQSRVLRAVDFGNIINCTTKEIQRYLDNPNDPILIIREEKPKELSIIMECLRDYCKGKGVKRFPMQKISDSIEEMIVLDNI